jgi:predicted transcriptional regulator
MRENDLLSLLASSKLRRDILLYLGDGPKTQSDIRDHLGVSSSQLSTKMKELYEYNLLSAEKKTYELSPQGKIVLENYWPFANTVDLFERQEYYWKTHDLNCIPEALRQRIGELHNSEYIEDDTDDLNRLLTTVLKIMGEAKELYVVSPIFDEDIVKKLLQVAMSGVPIEVVLTRSVYEKVLSENNEMARAFYRCGNYQDFVVEEMIKTPLILTDRHFYFTSYYTDGSYDTESSLISTDQPALKWGRDFFDYYIERAVKSVRITG